MEERISNPPSQPLFFCALRAILNGGRPRPVLGEPLRSVHRDMA